MKAETTFSLKDQLFNKEKVTVLAKLFSAAWPEFPERKFINKVVKAFPELGLKERITHMSGCLHEVLPAAYPDALKVLISALPPKLDPKKTDDDFGDFIHAPFSDFIARYGCDAKNLSRSLKGLRECTMRFSAEESIRYFINAFPEKTVAFLHKCAEDKNYHVRRLASEGTRPTLPWCPKIVLTHKDALPILEKLFADPTRYVTRSVANHMNDISKKDANLVVKTLSNWKKSGKQQEKEMDFIITHSLRTLVKQGHPGALKLIGFGAKPQIEIVRAEMQTPKIKVGESALFELEIKAKKKQKLLVDYTMYFAGGKGAKKVFKLKQLDLQKGETVTIKKKHPMRLMTTRRLYEGTHRIEFQINGQVYNELKFELKE